MKRVRRVLGSPSVRAAAVIVFAFILFAAFVVAVINKKDPPTVSDWHPPTSICAPHHGVRAITADHDGHFRAIVCQDGAVFFNPYHKE